MNISSWDYVLFDKIDSTNSEALRRIKSGVYTKTLIRAKTQTMGRGRLDRKWDSPNDAGLYFTLLFSPDIKSENVYQTVFVAACAITDTLKRLTGKEIFIKWPNDLVINGKKICGMLAQSVFYDDRCAIALGIGLNLTKNGLSDELKYASGLFEETGVKIDIDEFFDTFISAFDERLAAFEKDGLAAIKNELKGALITLDRDVRIENRIYRAIDLDDTGALIVKDADGTLRTVIAGDVSVRGVTDYV